jgi:tubulin polyglutamylase TTLL4
MVNSLKYAGFELLDNSNFWNVLWTRYVEASDVKKLNKYQKINHFPQSIRLSRKDYLWHCMYRLYQRFPKECNITPMTYIFPDDNDRFEEDREAEDNGVLYILKPVAASCGRGIKVIGKRTFISRKDGYLASKYICKPHLINELKYDLRVYVLVTGFDPLRVYVYNEGLVRFATEKYTLNPDDLKKRFVHLTNFSVNKKSENFKVNMGKEEEEDESSSKWSFKALKRGYEARGISYDFVFA